MTRGRIGSDDPLCKAGVLEGRKKGWLSERKMQHFPPSFDRESEEQQQKRITGNLMGDITAQPINNML